MAAYKKYKQLKLDIDTLQDNFNGVLLYFRLHQQPVNGKLIGNASDWMFHSNSPAFLKRVPSGKLFKYTLWTTTVPKDISYVYNAICESALKAGFDIEEKED